MIRKKILYIARIGFICLGILVLMAWAWSYVEFEILTITSPRGRLEIRSMDGVMIADYVSGVRSGRIDYGLRALEPRRGRTWWEFRRGTETWLERRGFQLGVWDGQLGAPAWFTAMLCFLIGSQGVIQRALVKRLPPLPRAKRPRIARMVRLPVIAIITAFAALPLVTLSARFTLAEAWGAVKATPTICGLFLIVPLIGIWLVRKPLHLQKQRLMLHRDRYLCTTCGYNLTANTSGVCPECGMKSTRLKPKMERESGACRNSPDADAGPPDKSEIIT